MLFAVWLACRQVTPFEVASSEPRAGATVAPDVPISLVFDEAVDSSCQDAVELTAVEGVEVAWIEDVTVSGGGDRLSVAHAPLDGGVQYAISVMGGDGGCHSAAHEAVVPFVVRFVVAAP